MTGGFTAADKVYDGNAGATVTSRSLSGAVSGDSVSLSGGTATFANKNVGNGKTVTLSGASLAGDGCPQLHARLGRDGHGRHHREVGDGQLHCGQ